VVLVTVHDEDPEPPFTLVGLQVTVSPVAGLTDVVRFTVPANPFWLVIVTVNVPVELPDNGRAAKW
jgi:hypothetical protein